jgi:Cu-Zn family superoxide dismutase
MKSQLSFRLASALLATTLAAALSAAQSWAAPSPAKHPVHVQLKDGKGASVGTAVLSAAEGGVKIKLHLTHMTPGTHAIHFHEKAECVGPDFKSAGGHFNPDHKEHGLDNPAGPHAGDMPNIELSRSGTIKTEFVAHGVTLDQGPHGLLRPEGAALVVHAKADDQKSNPAGNAGDRVACGVIAPVK